MFQAELEELCPGGIDVYFDNVGGAITDAVVRLINAGARISVCGQISQYNLEEPEMGPRWLGQLIVKQAKVQGFLVSGYAERFPEGLEQLAEVAEAGEAEVPGGRRPRHRSRAAGLHRDAAGEERREATGPTLLVQVQYTFEKGRVHVKPIQMAAIALLLGAVTTGAGYSQSPGYGSHPESRPSQDYDRDHDRGYDDESSPRVDVGFFYDELSPYGDWVQTRDYGWAWFPRNVHPYWRPYTDGRWVTTDYGWTWASNEPFGWATYHYGRWERDPRFGWLWVPGTVWGPAWVSWQYGGGYVGWAPLPPSVGFEANIGIRLGSFDFNIGIRPDAYSFVPERSFSRLAFRAI